MPFTFRVNQHELNFCLGLGILQCLILCEQAVEINVLKLCLNGGGFAFAARILRADEKKVGLVRLRKFDEEPDTDIHATQA